MSLHQAIGHLDADSYYVSAERARDEFLIGKPVGVLGNQGACVIARSREMKELGVHVGEPIWDAVKKCPDGVYVKRDFRWYEVLTRKMLDILCTLSPRVEYYSIDEFFFIAQPKAGQSMQQLAQTIRDVMKTKTRLPVTVGIARSRTMAKLITDQFKPFGATAITSRPEEEELLGRLPVDAISGIARRRASRLAPYNVRTCLDLCRMRRSLVKQLLTVTGETLWRELNGESVTPIQAERPTHQMLSRGGSIGRSTDDPMMIHGWLVRNLEKLIEELEFYQLRANRLTLWLVNKEGINSIGEVTLDSPTDRFDLLLDAVQDCFRMAWRGQVITGMHLIASQLRRPGLLQRSLFEPPPGKYEAITQLKRDINGKMGRFTIRSGATLPLHEIYHDEACDYDIGDVRGKVCF